MTTEFDGAPPEYGKGIGSNIRIHTVVVLAIGRKSERRLRVGVVRTTVCTPYSTLHYIHVMYMPSKTLTFCLPQPPAVRMLDRAQSQR